MNCICNNTRQDCELSSWHCPRNCNGHNKICTRHVLTQPKYGGKACGNLTKPNPKCEITPSVTGDQIDDWCGCPTYGEQTIGFNGRCNPDHKRSDYYSGPDNFWINVGEDVCKCAQDPDLNSSSCKAVQGNGPPLPSTITDTSPTDSASLFDVAKGWMRANGNNINSCKYAMAIAVGEGCICTGPSSAGVVHSEWGSTYGAFGSCDSNATHKFPCSGVYRSTEKQGFPKGNNGGPWQLTSVPTTCNSEKDWIKCYAKETMDYLNSTLSDPGGFIGCKNVMGNATKQGNICVAKYGNRPITWVFPNHVNNCGDSGGGDSGGSCTHPQQWLEKHNLDGVAAVPPIMYGDWGSKGQGCSFTPSNGGLCYKLTKNGQAKTVAIIGRCGGYSQCNITNSTIRNQGKTNYALVSKKLNVPQGSTDIVNVDGNFCLIANTLKTNDTSTTVAGSTPVCYALYSEENSGNIKSECCVCTGKEPEGFAGCNGNNQLKTCGANNDQACNVDWCASNLHPHFDLNSELISDMNINGADFIDNVEPVPCPTGPLRPTEGEKQNSCTGQEKGADVCECRDMTYVSLGSYGHVCIPNLPCNQDPYTNGLASKSHSDRCPTNIGKCVDGKCIPHTGDNTWIKQNFGVNATQSLISTFPRPTVTEYCDLRSGGCGGWNVACNVPELECNPEAGVLKKDGEPCVEESECISKHCDWSHPTRNTGVCSSSLT